MVIAMRLIGMIEDFTKMSTNEPDDFGMVEHLMAVVVGQSHDLTRLCS